MLDDGDQTEEGIARFGVCPRIEHVTQVYVDARIVQTLEVEFRVNGNVDEGEQMRVIARGRLDRRPPSGIQVQLEDDVWHAVLDRLAQAGRQLGFHDHRRC